MAIDAGFVAPTGQLVVTMETGVGGRRAGGGYGTARGEVGAVDGAGGESVTRKEVGCEGDAEAMEDEEDGGEVIETEVVWEGAEEESGVGAADGGSSEEGSSEGGEAVGGVEC